ncbi:MAG: hypothetical protein USCAAHI_00167 [Beijerinckiaceae bacterium]|nr:MAG: hypothetical protein USCAAHI_00167 [Beijerinckiaceae bacterium]
MRPDDRLTITDLFNSLDEHRYCLGSSRDARDTAAWMRQKHD